MKNLLFAIAILSTASSISFAKEVRCVSDMKNGLTIGNITSVEVTAQNLVGDWMKDVEAIVHSDEYDGPTKTIGRRLQLDSDANYKPRKYTDHKRYDLSHLTNVEDFGDFLPGDICTLSLMIPNSAAQGSEFKAPLVMNCDQSGGSITLNCSIN